MSRKFSLPESFIQEFKEKTPDFGFNGLGELVYHRTYSRLKKDGNKELWFETIRRVVEGVWTINWDHCYPASRSFEGMEMYRKMFHMKFLPPGRGLWAMGTEIVPKKGGAALNNCGFISTSTLCMFDRKQCAEPFLWAMDMLMLGVGIGFDTKGAGKVKIRDTRFDELFEYSVEDNREGWVFSLGLLLENYFEDDRPEPRHLAMFDYSRIRPQGEPIKIFGGTASGPACLKTLHERIRGILDKRAGNYISERDIVDIFNLIGCCVVAGNVRRSAELAIGSSRNEFLELKDYKINPERATHGWASNNSVFVDKWTDFHKICEHVKLNGEPGFLWLENMRNYGRMGDPPNLKDHRAMGGNPCLEQTLESRELCCLVEVFLARQDSLSDFFETLYFAYIYAKTVSMVPVHDPKTQEIIERNRRLGISLTGITQFLARNSLETLRMWLESGYSYLATLDIKMSSVMKIPPSIKLTSIKPSGTVSLIAGSTPGMHFPISRFYYRRIRLGSNDEDMVARLRISGYDVDRDPYSPESWVATFAVDAGKDIRTLETVGMWEQVHLAAFLQRYWADNQVSCTVTFDKDEEGDQIPIALQFMGSQLKAISFLPKGDDVYPLMPYQKITEREYKKYMSKTLRLSKFSDKSDPGFEEEDEKSEYCDNETCHWVFKNAHSGDDENNTLVIDE